jgi:O-antigen/teichoic acid export membrane protein
VRGGQIKELQAVAEQRVIIGHAVHLLPHLPVKKGRVSRAPSFSSSAAPPAAVRRGIRRWSWGMGILRSRLAVLKASRHLRSVGGTTVALIAAQVTMGVAGVIAARELGPAGRGVVTAVMSWPVLLGWISIAGLSKAASVRVARMQGAALATTLGSAVAYSLVIGGAVALGAIALIPPALAHLGEDAEELAVWALVTIPTIVLADILMFVNVALGRVTLANWCRLTGPLLLLAGTVLLALGRAVTPGRIVALTIASGSVALIIGASGLPWRRIALSVPELFADLKFGAKAHLASILSVANIKLDLVLMSAFVSASQVGYYGVANNLMLPVMSFAAAGALLLTPRVASMADTDRAGIDEGQLASIRRDGRRYLLVGALGAAGLATLAPVAVPLLFGSAFEAAVVLVWVLIPGYVARTYVMAASAGAVGLRRPWVGNVSEGAGFAVTIALLPMLLPRYDALGAAMTSTAAYCTSALVAMFAIRRLARQIRPSRKTTTGDHAQVSTSQPAPAVATRGGG